METRIKPFNKLETKSLLVIFLFLIFISIPNFNLSIKRARDSQRRDALGKITTFLKEFRDKNSFYPAASADGKIIGCNPEGTTIITYSECVWGVDFAKDPQANSGIAFKYISNGSYYQILAYLEVPEAGSEYQEEVFKRNINCGTKICNTGRASPRTPLDKSLEEYQNELDEKEKQNKK